MKTVIGKVRIWISLGTLLTGWLLLAGCTLELSEEMLRQEGNMPTSEQAATLSADPQATEVNTEADQPESADDATANTQLPSATTEQQVLLLPLPDELGSSNLEISAMDWFGDYLVLVPQYPERFGNQLFAIERQQLLDTVDGIRTGNLDVIPVPFSSGLLRLRLPRLYGGFEAIAFADNRVYLSVEVGSTQDMAGFVVAGDVASDLSEIVLDYENYTEIVSPTTLGNMSEETMLLHNGQLLTIYEANGVNINQTPVAHQLGLDLSMQGTLGMPNIEYRITDATKVDEDGRFWAINYFYPGDADKLQPIEPEPIAAQFGQGVTHGTLETVERLVEFQIGADGISLTGSPPIQLELFGGNVRVLGRVLGDEIPRNWEGLVRLSDRGFLLATDKFPDTLLGFVSFPE